MMGPTPWNTAFYNAMRGQEPNSIGMRLGLAPLRFASLLYGIAARNHPQIYARGWWPRQHLPCRVVSIGNLTVGGTGKTPLTLWVARWYHQRGWRVAVLSRGYGSQATAQPRVASSGSGPLRPWSEVGDEPYFLASELADIPVVVGANRTLSGRYAVEHFGAQVVVLDDGFQHHRLARDLDLVLIDATNPFGHGTLLPRGILREPLRALQRADAVILTRVEQAATAVSTVSARVRRWHGERPVYTMQTTVHGLRERLSRQMVAVEQLQGQRVVVFAGLGNPEAVAATVTQLGAEVAALLVFPDHYAYRESDWRRLQRVAVQYAATCLVTTTKDAVRLDISWTGARPVYAICIDVVLNEAHPGLDHQLEAVMRDADTR